MGFVGTRLSYRFLKHWYPGGRGVPMSEGDPFRELGISKLELYFGSSQLAELHDKVVVDFGCGTGNNALELVELGCKRVIAVDIQQELLAIGRHEAERRGLSDKVEFVTSYEDKADVVLTTDAFEHFADPAAILRLFGRILTQHGYAMVQFGPTWYHPLGGHLFSVFPWAHLVFTERSLIRWRSDFKSDGATRFEECAGGLNKLTISRWERLIEENGFGQSHYELRPVRAVQALHCWLTRELFTSVVIARLTRAA